MPTNEEALAEMPDEFVVCRMLRHNWNFIGFYHVSGPSGRKFVCMSLECSHCGMGRDDFLDSHGQLDSRHYEPPEGYNIKRTAEDKREGRIHVTEARSAMMERATIYASSSSLQRATKARK